ncbi:MAG: 4a-hydroxytetrahydrobiopterin dehydratase [Verrucomicrobiales bacterium]|nr:4a-hydroxytetrahydrobiopterin dehydratase [Verrucomicrobiales bacterium]
MAKMTPVEVRQALKELPGWVRRGTSIRRAYTLTDFPTAIRFVNAMARIAEKASHHPDIEIAWNRVTLTLTTHDEGGLTPKDFDLARQFDRKAA